MMTLQGRVCMVTGGSRGIGAATAKLLGQRGATVVVNYRQNAAAAAGVVAEITAAGGSARAIQADVHQAEEVQRLADATLSAFGRIDILVSNAGAAFPYKPFAAMAWDEFAGTVNDELRAAFELTRAVVPAMQEQNYGRIVYVSSSLARRAVPNFIAQGVAKAGLITFARYIAKEFGPQGITANVVSPAYVETDATAFNPPEVKQYEASFTALGRVATPEDIAGAIAFFASDDSQFMSGVYAPVNGGLVMDLP